MRRAILIIIFLLSGCKPNPPGNTEIQSWFNSNFNELSELVKLGEQHKALRRAEPSLKKYPTYYGDPSASDLEAEKTVYNIIEKLKIDFVAYWRRGDVDGFFGMTVPYYRWGLSLGGYSKSILYDPSNTTSRAPDAYSTYIYLNKPGWFIDVSDTR